MLFAGLLEHSQFQEYLRELTLSVARAAAMPISSEKYDKSTSSLKRHSSVSRKEANATNLLRSVNEDTDRKVIECNKKHKKDVDKLQETLNMLGMKKEMKFFTSRYIIIS